MVVLYGQTEYATMMDAVEILNEHNPEIPNDIFGGNIRGFIIIQKGCTDIDSAITAGTALITKGYTHGTHL